MFDGEDSGDGKVALTDIEKIKKLTDAMSVPELGELIRELEQEREGRVQAARDELLAEMQEKASALGLSPRQLVLGDSYADPEPKAKRSYNKKVKAAEEPAEPVIAYRNSDGATWSGRGRIPGWLKTAEAGGHSREEFKV